MSLPGAVLLLMGPLAMAFPEYESNPFVFALQQPRPDERAGGITVADVNNDGRLDFLYTHRGSVGAYRHDGRPLWVREIDIHLTGYSETEGLPGLHHPGVQAGDVDADGCCEVLFLGSDGRVVILDGTTGNTKAEARPPVPTGVRMWEHLVVANLRGLGDRDVILQACPAEDDYKLGRFVAAFGADQLDGPPLWQRDDFGPLAHGPLRIADINRDGRDEVLGYRIITADGRLIDHWDYQKPRSWHIDSLFVYDVRPDVPGLEIVLLEEGRNHVGLVNMETGLVWHEHYEHQEPQNAAVGRFDTSAHGLQIWCRSRYDMHQKPWVFDAFGRVISHYEMDKVAPEGWTAKGVEEIWVIDWTGAQQQLACAKERHEEGDVCLFEPMGGRFVRRFPERAARLFVADVAGDWREEIVVVNGTEVHVYWNEEPNPRPDLPRLWERNEYRRSKMNWNYYSP